MSRYIQSIIFFLVFLLAGCSFTEPKLNQVGQKSFENEDYMILEALEKQKNGNHKKAMQIYELLYEKSGKIRYLIEATKISFLLNDLKNTELLLHNALKRILRI